MRDHWPSPAFHGSLLAETFHHLIGEASLEGTVSPADCPMGGVASPPRGDFQLPPAPGTCAIPPPYASDNQC